MRYFLSSLIDAKTSSYVRDFYQSLNKYKRFVAISNVTELHFHYKYLGENLDTDNLNRFMQELNTMFKELGMMPFSHPLEPLKLGKKGEYSPATIAFRLRKDEALLQFNRLMQQLALNSLGDEIVQRKDLESWLGVIKVAEVKRNTSPSLRVDIGKHVQNYPSHPYVHVENICIIGKDLYRGKQRLRVVKRIDL